jgi:S1-C subfamily serine protease
VPPTWPDDDGIGDDADDDVAFDAPLAAPLHPDDRLWRHPSEMAWGVAPPAATAASIGAPKPEARTWVVAVTSGLTGAALALGMVVLFVGIGAGTTDRVTDRVGVRDRLADPMVAGDAESANAAAVAVARAVIPSVVRLEVRTARGTTTGSGVVLRDDGHIVTNAHVVDGARSITILQPDGTAVTGRLVGADALTDIAVVAPDDDDADDLAWEPAVRGPAAELTVGEPALTVGSPLGTAGAPSVTLGVISALDRRVSLVSGGVLHGMIQTDAPITGGASGGALCDRTGRVVGITTSAFAGESSATGFATPMETVWRVAESLIDDGVVHHVWLGIEGADLDVTRSSILGLTASVGGGVVVDRVLAGSPAEDADLRPGDVLVSVDGARLSSMSDLVVALRDHEPGDDVTLGVERDGDVGTATVTLGEREG